MKGIIFDIKKYAIHDGPGIRTTVFFKGCPLDCWWCHNPEGLTPSIQIAYRKERCIGCGQCVESCPEKALTLTREGVASDPSKCTRCGTCAETCPADARELLGREVGVEEVMQEIEKDTLFYDESGGGVTFSGGEPLMQPDLLMGLLRACGDLDIHRTVDTTGCADADLLIAVAKETDLFLYDLKIMSDEAHRKYTGISNSLILANLETLARQGVHITVRMPVIPGINTGDGNLSLLASFLSDLPGVNDIHLLPYHCAAKGKYRKLDLTYRLDDLAPPSQEVMTSVAERLKGFDLNVKIGG